MTKLFLNIFVLLSFISCTIPKFKSVGGLSENEKTINIIQYENNSGLGTSDIHVVFTEKTKDYFQQNTKLELIDTKDADIEMKCTITSYSISYAAAQAGGSTAALNKLQITVKVDYKSFNYPDDPKKNFEGKSYSGFANFSENEDLNSIESDLIEDIANQIVVKIFNDTAGSW